MTWAVNMLAVLVVDRIDMTTTPSAQLASAWLVAIARSRDREAFEAIYSHYAPKVKTYIIRQGADAATADDLAQETMVQIWRKAEQYDPNKAVPSAWIYRIARNLQIDRLRRNKFHEVEYTADHDYDDERDSEERTTQRIDADRLGELVKGLPDEQMEVVRLAFFDGLSHSEIGQRLSLPLGTVKSRLRLAFGKLRTAMGE